MPRLPLFEIVTPGTLTAHPCERIQVLNSIWTDKKDSSIESIFPLMHLADFVKWRGCPGVMRVARISTGVNDVVRDFFAIDSGGSPRATVARDFYTRGP